MPCDTILQDEAGHSTKRLATDVPRPRLRTITPTAVASSEPDRESADVGADRGPDAADSWIGCCERSGVVEIRDSRLLRPGHEAFCRVLVEAAVERFGADRAEVRLESSTCRLVFEPGRFDRAELATRAAGAIRSATPAVRDGSGRRTGWTILTAVPTAADGGASIRQWRKDSSHAAFPADHPIDTSKRSGRLVDLAMAGGSFVLAIGGVILPGVPTLPFVIMTGRYAVRVSPRLERLLTHKPWCATLLAEAETSDGPGFDWRSLAKTIGPAALFVAAILILHPPLPVVVALEMGLMAYMAWRELGQPGRIAVGLGSAV